MFKTRRSVLNRSIFWAFAAPVMLGGGISFAQEPVPAIPAPEEQPSADVGQTQGIEEIVVTARRKEEKLQDVPTAVTALTAKDLGDLQINNFGDVGKTVPNLTVQNQFGSASAPQFFLRGVATGSLKFETDAGVGLYIDGVYLGRPAGSAFDIADLERLEVLRGPQGTLFGRNSTGGAINFITAEPTGELGGNVELGFGDYSQRRAKATLNFPAFNGVAARVTVLHSEHDGYVDRAGSARTFNFSSPFGSITSADDFGADRTDAVGLAVTYKGIENLKLNYRFDYTDKKSTQFGTQLLGVYGGGGALVTALGGVPSTSRLDSLPLDFTSQSQLNVQGHSLTAEYEINKNLSVKNIVSYRKFSESVGGNDIDGGAYNASLFGFPTSTPFAYISSIQERQQDQLSNEFQLLGTSDRFDWITGLFYFKEKGTDNNPVFIGVPFTPGVTYTPGVTNGSIFGVPDYFAGFNGSVENKSVAAYGHGTYHITDAWDLSGGLRYTKDYRKENVIEVASIRNQSFNRTLHHTDGDVSLTYKVRPGFNVYGKYSTGYLTGGVLGGVPFETETIKSYELGLKSDLFNNRLRFNVSAFHTDRDNLQILSFSSTSGTFLANGGKSKQDGIEIEATAVPIDGLTLTANYGHVRDKFDNGFRSLSPKNNAFVSAEYEFPRFANGSRVLARVDAAWRDDAYGLTCPVGTTTDPQLGCTNLAAADNALDQKVIMKANTVVGARLSLVDLRLWGNTKGRISLWGRNLLNEKELEFVRDLANGTVVGTFQAPRTFGLDLSATF